MTDNTDIIQDLYASESTRASRRAASAAIL
jgi:hypothetical protein